MKPFEWNVNDVTTAFNLAEEISDECGRVAMIVMDSGFYSDRNVLKLYSEGHGFLMPMPSDRKLFKESTSASVKDLSNPLNTLHITVGKRGSRLNEVTKKHMEIYEGSG